MGGFQLVIAVGKNTFPILNCRILPEPVKELLKHDNDDFEAYQSKEVEKVLLKFHPYLRHQIMILKGQV